MPATPSAPSTQPNYPLIDLLRAFAALLVVAFHVLGQYKIGSQDILLRLAQIGWIGVDCFFVISGFVITLSALKDYERQPQGFRRGFALRRLARIAPLYVLTMVLFVFLVKPDLLTEPAPKQWAQWLSHLLFIHNLFTSTSHAINSPAWSIGLEMQFYLLMLLITPWLARASVAKVFLTLLAIGWGHRYLITFIVVPNTGQEYRQFHYTTQLPGTLDAFGLGIVFAMAIKQGRGQLSQWLIPGWRGCGLWIILALLLSITAWHLLWPRSGNYWNWTGMIVFWRSLLAATFASWLAVAITLPVAHWRIFKPVCYFGQISYGIYLWHMLVLITLLSVPSFTGMPLFRNVLFGTIVLAALSWHWLERPFMQRIKSTPRSTTPQSVIG